ncbi:MAG: hypothetical protein ACK4PR_10325, partial [Gammaproteobacteria bacterium]
MIKRKRTLLLGAGFTANFGAPLAKDIWLSLFNNRLIQNNFKLKNLLAQHMEDYDFESFYHNVISSNEIESFIKKQLTDEIEFIFKHMDEFLYSYIMMKKYEKENISIAKILGFLLSFSQDIGRGNGCIFSLNQDIFLERLCSDYFSVEFQDNKSSYRNINLITPGAFDSACWSTYTGKPISQDQLSNCVKNVFMARSKDELTLFKLHGSFNWKVDGIEPVMVIGRDKSAKINNFLMLTKYM